MRARPLVFLGRISYSLYLFHLIVILALVNGLYGHAPLMFILFLAGALSIVTAWCAYRFVEVPAMNLGRRLSGLVSHGTRPSLGTGAEATPP